MPIAFDSLPTASSAPVPIEVRPYYNPEKRTPVNIVPGLMGVILTMTMILFTSVAIVRERGARQSRTADQYACQFRRADDR